MNYLGHYVYNHEIRGLKPEPYFVMGVALPDLWPRFSRSQRIRWPRVRQARAADPHARHLRRGLLNHVAADRQFHTLAWFVDGQRMLKALVSAGEMPPTLLGFLTHIALELALDQRLVRDRPQRCADFYDSVASCDAFAVQRRVGLLAGVDAYGLAAEIHGFVARRFLSNFAQTDALLGVVQYVLTLTAAPTTPELRVIRRLLDAAAELASPDTIWRQMTAEETSSEAV